MQKIAALILTLVLATALCAGCAEEPLPVFGDITGLNAFMAGISGDNPIVSVFFTHGYGFSVAEFSSEEPEKIAAVLAALESLEITGTCDMDVTDWYPYLRLCAADGSAIGISFNGTWLEKGRAHYELNGIGEFYSVMDGLIGQAGE